MEKYSIENKNGSRNLVEFYQSKLREMRGKHHELMRIVEECKELVVRNADREDEFLKGLRETGKLQNALSELQGFLYKEREHVLRLTADNDRLKIQNVEDRRKIQFLLNHCGLKEHQLHSNKILDELASPSKRKQKPKVRFHEVKDFNQKIKDFQESELGVLRLKTKALEGELKEQTDLLQDEIVTLEKDLDLKKKEWAAERKRLEQQVSCLSCRLQNTQLRQLDQIFKELYDIDKMRNRELVLVEENERLKAHVKVCKEILGEDFMDTPKTPSKHKTEVMKLKEQLAHKDFVLNGYQRQAQEFECYISTLRKELTTEREQLRKLKEKWQSKEEYLTKKLEEERRRRLLEGEGFTNDIKLLRSKFQSIERQMKHQLIRRRHETDN